MNAVSVSRLHPGSRRERRSFELRQRIFRAALALFGKKGYAQTTVEDITEAADVGKGTFFNYFPSKEHLLLAFSEMQLAKLEGIVREISESRLPLRDSIHHLVGRMTELPIQNPAVVRALLQAHLSSQVVREQMFVFHRKQQQLMGRLFALGQQRREIRSDLEPEEIAQVMRQTIFGTLLFWSLIGDASLTPRIEQSLELLWNGIAEPRPAKEVKK
jgi:AcrR family transcriptional regulator